MRSTAVLAGVAAGVSLTLVPAASPAVADTPAPRFALPAPTGPYPVGLTTLDLLDRSRADPWVPTERRELMVSVWYPAAAATGRPAPYVTAAESAEFLRFQGLDTALPPDALTTVRTHARVGAPVLRRSHGLPLIVLSPGFSMPRATLTGLAEDLASRGYVVAGVDHTYEAAGVSFPDGRITGCLPCAAGERPVGSQVATGRAADVSFVLDRLTGPRPAWRDAAVIDRHRIAMAGHSIGGASALTTMSTDRRVRAGVNLDGSFFETPTYPTIHRPFLMIGKADHVPGGFDDSWDGQWARLAGYRRWVTVADTTHSSFTDLAVLADQLGQPLQPLPGERAALITREYVAAFFDRTLRHRPGQLLNRPSPTYPEVTFEG